MFWKDSKFEMGVRKKMYGDDIYSIKQRIFEKTIL